MSDAPIFFCGHSLGASRAILAAWSRLKRGLRVDGVYAFAPPNPGDSSIGAEFWKRPTIVTQTLKNRRELVMDVPVDIEFLHEEYDQPWSATEINEYTRGFDTWGPFRDHRKELYVRGAGKISIDAPVTVAQASELAARIYDTADGWDWINPVDGQWCAIKTMPSGAKLVTYRGSQTEIDWLDDFDACQITVMGSRVSQGFWRGVEASQDAVDAQL
jgi:hypothetical protein